MDFIKKNRGAAAVILVAAVILSFFLGTWRSVSKIADELGAEFTQKDKYGETVSGTVNMLRLHITTFVSEYKAVLGNCGEATVLLECAAALSTSDGTVSAAVNVDQARNAAALMHQRLDASDNYSAEAKAAYAGIDNDISILKKYDSYNAAAKKYNEAASAFGGKLFGLGQAIEF